MTDGPRKAIARIGSFSRTFKSESYDQAGWLTPAESHAAFEIRSQGFNLSYGICTISRDSPIRNDLLQSATARR